MRKFSRNSNNKRLDPTEEQIKRNQDFKRFSHAYEQVSKRPKKPIYKDPKRFIYLLIFLIIIYLIFTRWN